MQFPSATSKQLLGKRDNTFFHLPQPGQSFRAYQFRSQPFFLSLRLPKMSPISKNASAGQLTLAQRGESGGCGVGGEASSFYLGARVPSRNLNFPRSATFFLPQNF